ncbi:hypothetical protein JKF63_07837 [Porcisia hertigi]|uniref:Small nuclear ribonucleoprotein Prp3 C-terminal domain-containing protein n=1 Tax=Porcisia hertigi TaxID=2761500 RepID=A0A836YH38_9TRYP|nr:hypothetical protein JKF63_07837 [Porcisia hertigi]
MPPLPSKHHATRKPLSIDDVAIDFSTVSASAGGGASAATSAAPGTITSLLDVMTKQQQSYDGVGGDAPDCSGGRRYQGVSDVRAFDPALQGVMQRYANLATPAGSGGGSGGGGPARRKKTFFGAQQTPQAPSAAPSVAPPASSSLEASQVALDFLAKAQQHQQSSPVILQQRREAYLAQLRTFCQRGRMAGGDVVNATQSEGTSTAFPHCGHAQTNSLLLQLFADGVPDIEPWDRWTSSMPRYADVNGGGSAHLIVSPVAATMPQIRAAQLDLVHHPVIPDTHYTHHYQYRDLEQPVIEKVFKTKEELRAERRERLRAKQAKAQQDRKAAAAVPEAGALLEANGSSGGLTALTLSAASRLLHDRLSTRNLVSNLFGSSVLNPLAADTQVLQQYELRNLEHQRRNHDRHVAALPDQILKRARDQRRHATESPLLRAYRVFPVYSAAHLGKIRNFANDNLLRGFVLYVDSCDALIVLTGGEVAMRHLDRWVLHKMVWEHPDTRAVRLCSVPLMDAQSFSYHLKKAQGGGDLLKRAKTTGGVADKRNNGLDDADRDAATEPVFINMVSTVEEAEAFLRRLPAPSSPWSDLCGVWRVAFLPDGLQTVTTGGGGEK